MSDANRRVLIIGGGPGGLTAAIALQRVGIGAEVFERAAEFRESGSGLGVQANAMKALKRIGVADAILRVSPVIEWQEIYTAKGKLLARLPAGEVGREFGMPSLAVHRRDLQTALLGAIDRSTLHLSAHCVGFEQDEAGVTARFADGRTERGAVLVGADGMHSAIRSQLLGDSKPKYAGHFSWRGVVVPGRETFPSTSLRMFVGREAFFAMFNVGLGRVYWTGQKMVPEGGTDAPGGRKREAQDHFRGFPDPVEAVIAGTDEADILRNDVYDRDPDTRWGTGRVTLLGDSAHLTTPNLGQGAGIAIEDGVVLAKDLALTSGLSDQSMIDMTLRSYERKRMARTASIILESRRIGELYRWKTPFWCWVRDTVLRMTPHRVWRQRMEDSLAYEI